VAKAKYKIEKNTKLMQKLDVKIKDLDAKMVEAGAAFVQSSASQEKKSS